MIMKTEVTGLKESLKTCQGDMENYSLFPKDTQFGINWQWISRGQPANSCLPGK